MTNPGIAVDYAPLGTNTEFEDLTLPRDKINSFRYFVIINPRFTFFLLLDPAIIGIFSFWFAVEGPGFISVVLFLIVLILTVVTLLTAADADKHSRNEVLSDTCNSVSFLGEVVRFRPGADGDKWNLIAARLNRVFHRNNSTTPYFFYDGADCHSCFKSWYVNQAKVGDANRSETENIESSNSEVTDANRSETENTGPSNSGVTDADRSETENTGPNNSGVTDANKSGTVNIGSNSFGVPDANGSETAKTGLQLIIDEAVKVYNDSLEEYWRQFMAEINDISGQNNIRSDFDKDQTLS